MVQTTTLAIIGMAPDLDLLWGRHSRETHSIGAALIVAAIAAWRRWPVGAQTRSGIFAMALAAWGIHPILDVFSVDSDPPLGVMLWWPFSHGFVHSAQSIFDPISRYWTRSGTWPQNFAAAGHELMLLAPLLGLVWYLRRR